MASYWSNQVAALDQATEQDLVVLHYPSHSGSLDDAQYWFKASMLWSGYAGSKSPEAVGKLINWWVNDKACADICLDERGVPANADMVAEIKPKLTAAGKTSVKYLEDIKPELGNNPVAPPPGGSQMGDIMTRHCNDILFGKDQVPSAAKKIIDELNTALKS